jgi:hypothetical protein
VGIRVLLCCTALPRRLRADSRALVTESPRVTIPVEEAYALSMSSTE